MSTVSSTDLAILELVAMQPLSVLPPDLMARADKLRRMGLVLWRLGCWYPTATGLVVAGRTVH